MNGTIKFNLSNMTNKGLKKVVERVIEMTGIPEVMISIFMISAISTIMQGLLTLLTLMLRLIRDAATATLNVPPSTVMTAIVMTAMAAKIVLYSEHLIT